MMHVRFLAIIAILMVIHRLTIVLLVMFLVITHLDTV